MHRVILAGRGRARAAWREVIGQSARLELAAETDSDLSAALDAHPDALVAAALPPRAALAAAELLSERKRHGIITMPALELSWPEPAAGVQVDHGWVTLPGRAWLESVLARGAFDLLRLRVAGLPDAPGGDPEDVLEQALALASRLAPEARMIDARTPDEATTEVVLAKAGLRIELLAVARGHGLEVELAPGKVGWAWRPHTETRRIGERTTQKDVPPPEIRALRQLVLGDGDDLARAARVRDLVLEARARVPGRAPGPSVFASGAIGLSGDVPKSSAKIEALEVHLPPEPMEVWAYRAGLKPVVFLTLPPEDEPRARGWLSGAHIERRARRVATDAQDAWTDRRDFGEPRIEVYASRDPALARRAAELQAEPGSSVAELGALMGYPECCVRAFSAQIDRSNNSRNRYATAARTRTRGPWPWQLDNAVAMLVPFFPCSYVCPRAVEFADRSIAAAEIEHPGLAERLRSELGRPVLYFLHDRALVFEKASLAGDRIVFQSLSVPAGAPDAFQDLAGAVAEAGSITWTDTELATGSFRLRRVDPALGILLPFAPALAQGAGRNE